MQLIDLLDNGETVCKVPDKYGLRGYSFTASQLLGRSRSSRLAIELESTIRSLCHTSNGC